MPHPKRPAPGTHTIYTPRAALPRRRPATSARLDTRALAARLTDRDLWLCGLLHEHRVMTTHQLTALFGIGQRSVNRRLRTLYLLGVLDSFRPLTRSGSAPEHYVLGRSGAEILAAHHGVEVAATGWRKDTLTRTAFSAHLIHDLGVNTLLTSLAAHHHDHPEQSLDIWLAARSAGRLWGDHVRPDAYAHWRCGRHLLPFFLEYDTGTESLARVEAKLPGYAALSTSTSSRTPLLLLTCTSAREANLRRRLALTADRLDVPMATASLSPNVSAHRLGWLPMDRGVGTRSGLDDLASSWPGLSPAFTNSTSSMDLVALSTRGPTPWPWRPVPPLPPATPRGGQT
ncbi:replication-relaxation family protein [Streptomyces boninensis]|uniref:replication-relaxation family protein n=1 Tax=Streptomyces boninensis TaxID=2039455 RepID=UPI003B225EE2